MVLSGGQEKRNHYSCEGGIEKSVPPDHHLSSLGKPRESNQWSSGRIFLSHPHTHDGYLYSQLKIQRNEPDFRLFSSMSLPIRIPCFMNFIWNDFMCKISNLWEQKHQSKLSLWVALIFQLHTDLILMKWYKTGLDWNFCHHFIHVYSNTRTWTNAIYVTLYSPIWTNGIFY